MVQLPPFTIQRFKLVLKVCTSVVCQSAMLPWWPISGYNYNLRRSISTGTNQPTTIRPTTNAGHYHYCQRGIMRSPPLTPIVTKWTTSQQLPLHLNPDHSHEQQGWGLRTTDSTSTATISLMPTMIEHSHCNATTTTAMQHTASTMTPVPVPALVCLRSHRDHHPANVHIFFSLFIN